MPSKSKRDAEILSRKADIHLPSAEGAKGLPSGYAECAWHNGYGVVWGLHCPECGAVVISDEMIERGAREVTSTTNGGSRRLIAERVLRAALEGLR